MNVLAVSWGVMKASVEEGAVHVEEHCGGEIIEESDRGREGPMQRVNRRSPFEEEQ